MLAKGSFLYDFAYTFSLRPDPVWNFIKAVDFKHAAMSLYRRTPPSERSKHVRLYSCGVKDVDLDYSGSVFGLKTFFC